MAETGPLTQSTDESEDISGGAESDEDQDLRADESDGLADATCSLADEQMRRAPGPTTAEGCAPRVARTRTYTSKGKQVPTSRHRRGICAPEGTVARGYRIDDCGVTLAEHGNFRRN